MTRPGRQLADAGRNDRPVLITGGAGFVGTNLAHRLLESGRSVILFDNLSRGGVDRNVQWLCEQHGGGVRVEVGDVRDARAVRRVARSAGAVFHFAAQVAVTTSLRDPIADFEVNARGTITLLEALRNRPDPPPLVFTSTNKVYGDLEDLALEIREGRYSPTDEAVARHGIDEGRPLRFHSPYGCSKGTADQYVLDYAHTFGMPAAVFRMSCIYGPHQCGSEDQGWVAHFLIQAIDGKPITLYGDGMQVRDVLFVDDLVDACLLAERHMPHIAGEAFNIGGGPQNTTSLVELIELIETLQGEAPIVEYDAWRTADQRYYVSDTRRFGRATGWRPRVALPGGLRVVHDWLIETRRDAPVAHLVTGTVAS
jgi:CDP-paratose 2-epimerase